MNVIRRGQTKADRKFEAECEECGSLIGAFGKELEDVEKDSRSGVYGATGLCPVCAEDDTDTHLEFVGVEEFTKSAPPLWNGPIEDGEKS